MIEIYAWCPGCRVWHLVTSWHYRTRRADSFDWPRRVRWMGGAS